MDPPPVMKLLKNLTRLFALYRSGEALNFGRKVLNRQIYIFRSSKPQSDWETPVDERFYLKTHRDAQSAGSSGHDHFVKDGYRNLCNPRLDFDLCWYTQTYLLGTPDQNANALEHYNRVGASKGYLTRPPVPVLFDQKYSKPLGKTPRRICLFAAYDPDGLVDETVVTYLRDLSKFADVYYLADCQIAPQELTKLDGLVKGAWARQHGKYDIGSYSILARDLVGWDVVETYDELILANDSCYLVHSLQETFEKMSKRPCAWWSLQATKGMISTMHQNKIPEGAPIPISEIKEQHLTDFENDATYDFLLGSYFWAFRKDVINDPGFRRILDTVEKEENKLNIIRKYEIGITRFLIGKGYEFDTLVGSVSKEQPVFTMRAFDLIDEGFPLLKRYFLSNNHYQQKGLYRWKARVERANPDVDLSAIERNLFRVSDADLLYASLRGTQDNKLSRSSRSSIEVFVKDRITPKYDHWWAFPVCAYSDLFSDNTRAVFERVKNDPKIKKIILTRSVNVDVGGVNVVVAPLDSYEGQNYLLRSRQVFLRHGVRSNARYFLSSKQHNFFNLWHGIPLKRIGYTSLDRMDILKSTARESNRLRSVISASDVDRLAMAAAFWPLTYHDIWVTGLPRHDFIMADEADLPTDFHPRLRRLRGQLDGKKFLLFAPTFRADQKDGYYKFSDEEVQRLTKWLTKHNMVMGVREHMADTARLYSSQLQGDCFFDASERYYPDIELLYREADMLLTDYSSCFIDFMLTRRPVISFAFDQANYANSQRGLFYEQELVFPGPVCTDFDGLIDALDKSVAQGSDLDRASYDWKVKFFHKYADTNNSQRVVRRVKETFEGSKTPWRIRRTPSQVARSMSLVMPSKQSRANEHRLNNLLGDLPKMGWACQAIARERLTPRRLRESDVLIVCGLPADEKLLDICETFRLQGGRIIYDVGELIHDIDEFRQSDRFLSHLDHASDFMVISERVRHMIDTADQVIVANDALVETLPDADKPIDVVPNSIASECVTRYSELPDRTSQDGKVRIVYMVESAGCSGNFAQCRDAVASVLERHPQAELHIIGDADLTAEHTACELPRIVRHDVMTGQDLHDLLRKMDINLAPLAPVRYNDCASEATILQAALHGVPSIASPAKSYVQAIKDNRNAMIAHSPDDWDAALEKLITDTDYRRHLGATAFKDIVPAYSTARSARLLVDILNATVQEQ
ncbi:CDP-glycerol glycerophosphotransferase family protein [Aliiroseovarius sp. Z3]|uniref:CDP-glycerol glycerophosphotransferase family protein n=1 Tax=Aliiroseovarius sp. Z3 TaxID=2811402 RepID=UPI0023B2B79F|nr:CDP-glycerol glycerophosphotransferase family protein [Aliiroseovarius sp. Z3]MDE9451488.1 CDP-glycerol glycerophosphotransferase family protein [Aliiroseovarius sp. Z3]